RQRADDYILQLASFTNTLNNEQVHPDRRGQKARFHQNDDEYAVPDWVVSGLDDDRSPDGGGRDHHRQRFHKHAEDDVEDDHKHQRPERRELQRLDQNADLLRQTDGRDDDIEEISADHDRHDQAGGTDCSLEDLIDHLDGHAFLKRSKN